MENQTQEIFSRFLIKKYCGDHKKCDILTIMLPKPGELVKIKRELLISYSPKRLHSGTILLFLKTTKNLKWGRIDFWFLTLNGQKICVPFGTPFDDKSMEETMKVLRAPKND